MFFKYFGKDGGFAEYFYLYTHCSATMGEYLFITKLNGNIP
jgi:hypothetical protein